MLTVKVLAENIIRMGEDVVAVYLGKEFTKLLPKGSTLNPNWLDYLVQDRMVVVPGDYYVTFTLHKDGINGSHYTIAGK